MDSKPNARALLLTLTLVPASFAAALPAAAADQAAPAAHQNAPTVEEAQQFMDAAEKRLLDLAVEAGRAAWVQANFITEDTQALAAVANDRLIAAGTELAQGAKRFDGLQLSPELARKMLLLKLTLTLPAPADAGKRSELTRIAAAMEADYGSGKWCPPGKSSAEDCLDIGELSKVLAESRDPAKLQEAWTRWHSISPPIRKDFVRYVELANEGARELGFKDLGAMWRSKYDMPPDAFAAEVDRLWGQVKPFYDSLHCYVRAELNGKYGDAVQPKTGPIRADLLGNMWAQEWGNVYDVVATKGGGSSVDVTKLLEAKKVDAIGMVKIGERFYTSLGFEPLPKTFWERSLFTQPRDRDVVCHASAWSIDYQDDLRIKMCIETTGEDLVTIHHELGHNFYQRAYNKQPVLFQDSANDGFHEAIGDTIALSVTPEYLKEIDLLDKVPPAGDDTPQLLRMALDKIAFLPFGLVVDQWRWKVFSGEITPDHYNAAWWELRQKYQGVAPPAARSEADFDPAAKYHVAANVPYTRYFLARILQFQFQRALCKIAGDKGPLHRCSIYGSKEAGKRLDEMLSMGVSRPWPEALQALTGESRIDATAIQDYFAPLKTWLDEQNAGRQCGW
ncbi:MAG TPA: M2 family metallopeptidase [Thermoanaerobaculia bacterium]|nr:M2 family metallopeptidase [Thermoanaerobaculia bacterium]